MRWERALIAAMALAACAGPCVAQTAHSHPKSGPAQAQRAELIKELCVTAAREDRQYNGKAWSMSDLIVDASLEYAMGHGMYIQMAPDLAKARGLMRAALAGEPQDISLAQMCRQAGHPLSSGSPPLKEQVRAAVAAASP